MAVNHALYTPFKVAELDADELQAGLVAHVAYSVASASAAQALDLTGLLVPALILGTDIFAYDETDTTTVHDGTTCLVTADGKRFKNDGTRVNGWAGYTVDDDDLTAPPGSPAIGDSYLLPAAPTGAWSAYGRHVAIYTQRGWVFIAPRDGMLCYVADEDAYLRYNGMVWVSGFGSATITDGALTPQKLEQALGWRVESETATPPGSFPAAGTLYIVGASATGAWAGEDGNIARSTGSAWEFVTAETGMTVFNKAFGYNVSFKNGSWQVDRSTGAHIYLGPLVERSSNLTISDINPTTILDFGARTAESIANRMVIQGTLDFDVSASGTRDLDLGLYIDDETTPRDTWQFADIKNGTRQFGAVFEFEINPPDGLSHTYYLKGLASDANDITTKARGRLSEYAA